MSTVQYKCKNCGAPISFSAENQNFTCEYCESVFLKEELENHVSTEEVKADKEELEYSENMNEYRCSGCGAEIVMDKNTSATFCMYCNAPIVLQGRLKKGNKPSKMIPFKVSQQQAYDEYKKWIKKKWFLPAQYKNVNPENLKGMYVPYWLYDCKVDAETVWKCEDTETKNDRTITKKYIVEKDGFFYFKNIPIDASKSTEDELVQSVEPFDYDKLIPFSMEYMSGFYSDKFDVNKSAAYKYMYQRVSEGIEDKIEETIDHDTCEMIEHDFRLSNVHSEYVLLPVWFMMNEYAGEKYYFAMNGESGKIAGILPLDKGKAILFSILIGVITFILGIPLALLLSWI